MSTATQVESFCESCGTRYAFEPRRQRGRHLVRVGRLVGILPDDADIDSSALVVSRDPFHGAFHFCLECRRFTCPSCWDTSAGFCRSCALATGVADHELPSDNDPDPETEAILQSALASLLEMGSHEAWQRLEPPPAPRAEIWAAPPELVESPSDDMAPIIEAGLAALGAKALVESERAAAEAEQRRLADELRLHEEQLAAEQAEQTRLAHEAQQAYEADQGRLAWEAEQARLAAEAQQAFEADQGRLAWEAEQARLAEEARLADEARIAGAAALARLAAEARVVEEAELGRQAHEAQLLQLSDVPGAADSDPVDLGAPADLGAPSDHPAPPEWTALASSLGPDVEPSLVAEAAVPAVAEAAAPAVAEVARELETIPAVAIATPEPVPGIEPVTPVSPPAEPEAIAPVRPAFVIAEAVAPPEFVAAAEPVATAEPVAWVPPVSPPPPAPQMPVMPPILPPPPPPQPVAWQITAPVAPPPGQWAPPPPGWTPNQMPMHGASAPVASRHSRSGFLAAPLPGPVKGGVRPCPRCDLPLSGQARFCRRCGLPQG